MEYNQNQNVVMEEESAFDFLQLWNLLLKNWYWVLASMVACVLVAFIYLWFTPTTVTVTGKMEIIDKSKKSGGMSAGLAMLNSLPMGLGSSLGGSLGGSLGVDAEKEIIMSNTLVRKVVNDLDLHTEYRLSKWGRKTLLYQDNPVTVSLDPAHLQWMDDELPLTFHQIQLTISKDDQGYTVETTLKENKEETDLPDQTFATLPATIKTEAGTLTLTENKLTAKQAKAYEHGYTLKVAITPPKTTADAFIGRLTAEPPSKKVTNMLALTQKDENVIRGIDFVNHLVEAYNDRANNEKNEEARKTDEFVNERLAKIDTELGSSDAAWEESKKNFQITDPSADAGEVIEKKSLYEAQLVSIGVQLQLQNYMKEFVDNPENLFELIPVNVGMTDDNIPASGDAVPMISRHNALVNQRKDLLKSMSEQAPQVQRLTETIRELHPNIQTAMQRDRQAILIRKQNVEREYSKYMGRVNTAPKMERVLTEIGRQREIKQGVYLLMLQKREETAMELANTTDKGKLIDETTMDVGSNNPKKSMVLLVALFLGALLPMGILYLLQMFKTRIDTKAELQAVTKLPILAELPHGDSSEAIRTARTNLLLQLKDAQKVILVASDQESDGKTYIARQLTDSLAAIGKKAQYINGDLRSSASSRQASHPADYLAGADFAHELQQAKAANDYVILDSPAISQYVDAYQLAQYADATLYVVRAGKTGKSVLESLCNDDKLPNPCLILNAIQ